jgi:hypothetical protein
MRLTDGKTIVITKSVYEGFAVNKETTLILGKVRLPQEKNIFLRWSWGLSHLFGFSAPDDHRSIAIMFLKKWGVEAVLGEFLDYSSQWVDVLKDNGFKFFARAHGYDVSQRLRDEYGSRNIRI